jgi:preprotein translocase subunit SecA
MYALGMKEGIPIESRMISKRIEHAQKSVEAQNFEARKHLLEYDDVMNKQRETIYSLRRSFLEGRDQKEFVLERAGAIADELVEMYCPRDQHPDQWNATQFANEVLNQFGLDPKTAGIDVAQLNHDELVTALHEKVEGRYQAKETLFTPPTLRWLERHILLDIVDGQWKDHLLTLDHLKEGIGLRGYGQKDPLVEFKKEAFTLFDDLMNRIDTEAVRFLFLMQPAKPQEEAKQIEQRQQRQARNLQFQAGPAQAEPPKPVRSGAKVGRNDPCPCGSGKKYKKCHGAAA